MRSARITLAAGLALLAVALVIVLSGSPPAVLATNSASEHKALATSISGGARACQSGESLPADTRAIQLSLEAFTGPPITVRVLSGKHVVSSGARSAAWSGNQVTVPVRSLSHRVAPVTICFATRAINEELTVYGMHTTRARAALDGEGNALSGRLRIAFLGGGHTSWFSRASTIASRMGLGHAWSGSWVVPFVLVLMLTAFALAARLTLRELDE